MQKVSLDIERVKGKLLAACDPAIAPLEAWPLISGSHIASQTRAVEFQDRTLQVLVPTNEWQRELTSLAADYLRKLNNVLPGAVKRITFITTGSAGKKS